MHKKFKADKNLKRKSFKFIGTVSRAFLVGVFIKIMFGRIEGVFEKVPTESLL